jgi:predicted nucleic acid-binding protein
MKTSARERALLDTNLLVYAGDTRSQQHADSKALRMAAARGEIEAFVTTQILLEYVSVVTNPKRTASPIGSAAAWIEVNRFMTAFPVLSPTSDDIREVGRLAESLNVSGPNIFDLSIAATALRAEVSIIYTYDDATFSRIPGLTVRKP